MTQNQFCFLFKLKSSLSFDNLATHNTCETTHLGQGKTCTGAHKNCMHCEMHIYIYTHFVRILPDTMKYAWHINFDMFMKYKLCRTMKNLDKQNPSS